MGSVGGRKECKQLLSRFCNMPKMTLPIRSLGEVEPKRYREGISRRSSNFIYELCRN